MPGIADNSARCFRKHIALLSRNSEASTCKPYS